MKNIIVTGAAGFIATNLIEKLLKTKEYRIVGIDNFDPYYDIKIKDRNVQINRRSSLFECVNGDITEEYKVEQLFKYANYEFNGEPIDAVVHLAAQAGVGHSMRYPLQVIDTNIKGFDIMVRMSHQHGVKKFIYASSSTVLGDFNGIYQQKSTYGITKATNELQGHMYANMYPDMEITGLRLYTVYGKRMRPDLAIYKFTKAILDDEPIHIYGDGTIKRDFTYIDDVTDAFKTVIDNERESKRPGWVYNVGWGKPCTINKLIDIIKKICGKEDYDKIIYEDGKPYDAVLTCADENRLEKDYGFKCKVTLEEGLKQFKDYLYNS